MSTFDLQSLPSEWKTSTLSEIAEINPRLQRSSIEDSTEVNFVPMRAVEPDGGGLTKPEVRTYGEVKKGFTSFLSNDVIMAKITPCMENGKTTVVPNLPYELCFGSTEFHVVRAERGILPSWIANFLLQHEVRRAAQRRMTGGVGQMRVPEDFLAELSIPVAPAGEQLRISDALDELLSDLDAAVEALTRARNKLSQYRASVLKAAVRGDLTTEWRKKHLDVEPASTLLQAILKRRREHWELEQLRRFKANGKNPPVNWKGKYKEPAVPDTANLPILPTGWTWATAEQLCDFITKGTTPSGADAPAPTGEIPFIKVQHLSGDNSFLFENSPSYVSRGINDGFLARSKVFPGDVLMNIVGPPLGQVSIVPADFPVWNINQAIAIFRSVRGIDNRYLALCLSTHSLLVHALKRAKATAGQVNLTLEICRELPIPVPPMDEQAAILEAADEQFSTIQHLAGDLTVKREAAKALRQSILRHAFSGKLVQQDPKEEHASELLSRIAAERGARTSAAEKKTVSHGLASRRRKNRVK